MGNCNIAVLLGAQTLLISEASNCWASSDTCLQRVGCRWYEYSQNSKCELCESAFPDRHKITGCRDWTPFYFCRRVYQEVLAVWRKDPTDPSFRSAMEHFSVWQGSGEDGNPNNKEWRCSVWCDASEPYDCHGQPRAIGEFRGVNYGGRFVPEQYLQLPGTEQLFKDIQRPENIQGKATGAVSLCDVGQQAADARERMVTFLELNIKREHFSRMASLGFNVVRLPLGYWNVIDLPGSTTPNGPTPERWRGLQRIMPASDYWRWIDRVFEYSSENGMQVLLDLHGAPGGQTGNAFTGCDMGKGSYYFDTKWNKHLAVLSIEKMAQRCRYYNEICYGIELLNEPSQAHKHLRPFLHSFYQEAMRVARQSLDMNTPLVIMEWTYMLPWWRNQTPFSYSEYGRVMFSTHLYDGFNVYTQGQVRNAFKWDLCTVENFFYHSKHEVLVTEYALSGHGDGDPQADAFDYHSLANWLVHQMNQRSLGSAIWNYDADVEARMWGPVAEEHLGVRPVQWSDIFRGMGGGYPPGNESVLAMLKAPGLVAIAATLALAGLAFLAAFLVRSPGLQNAEVQPCL